jgi:hypothetical protein
MAFSRKALKARGKVREVNRTGINCDYVAILEMGEKAARNGHQAEDNPFPPGSEDFDTWEEGRQDYLKYCR